MSQTKKILTPLPTLRAQLSEMERERDAAREEADQDKEKLSWEIVALSERLSEAREQLTSSRTLILNIKRGNIYQEPADECDKWLNGNPETK